MKKKKSKYIQRYSAITISMALFAVILTAALAFGHGGKHSNQFTQSSSSGSLNGPTFTFSA